MSKFKGFLCTLFFMIMFLGGYALIDGFMDWKGIHGEVEQLNEITEEDMTQFPYVEGNISSILGPYCEEETRLLYLIGIKERYYLIPMPNEEEKFISVKIESGLFSEYDANVARTENYIMGTSGFPPLEIDVQGKFVKIDNGVQAYMEEAVKEMFEVPNDAKLKTMISPYCIEVTSNQQAIRNMLIGGAVFGICLIVIILNIKSLIYTRNLNKRWNQAMTVSNPYNNYNGY